MYLGRDIAFLVKNVLPTSRIPHRKFPNNLVLSPRMSQKFLQENFCSKLYLDPRVVDKIVIHKENDRVLDRFLFPR
jgi:hypothetical protein